MLENEESRLIFDKLIRAKITIDELEYEKAAHRLAAYEFLKDRPSLLAGLSTANERKFLKYCIERDYKLFISLDKGQYTEELAELFFVRRVLDNKECFSGFIGKSYDDKILLNLNYRTCDGEEVIYFDSDIETMTFLFANVDFTFKVTSVLNLFKKLDVGINHFGFNAIKTALIEWITAAYRKIVTELVTNKKVGIYKLNVMHEEIEQTIKKELNKQLDGCLTVEKVLIKKLSVSNAVSDILQKQGLELLSERSKKKSDLEYEKRALENYAKKAEIHTQNPQFELTLTEAEKDYALDRYIKKRKFDLGIVDAIPKDTQLYARGRAHDETIDEKVDKPVLVVEKTKKPWVPLYVFASIFALAALIIFVTPAHYGIGLIMLSFAILFSGIGTAKLIAHKVSKKNVQNLTEKEAQDELDALKEEYKSKMRG